MAFLFRAFAGLDRQKEKQKSADNVNKAFHAELNDIQGRLEVENDDLQMLLEMIYDSSFPESQKFLKEPAKERLHAHKETISSLLFGLASQGVPVTPLVLTHFQKHGSEAIADTLVKLLQLVQPLLASKDIPEFTSDDILDAIDVQWHSSVRSSPAFGSLRSSRAQSPLQSPRGSVSASPRKSVSSPQNPFSINYSGKLGSPGHIPPYGLLSPRKTQSLNFSTTDQPPFSLPDTAWDGSSGTPPHKSFSSQYLSADFNPALPYVERLQPLAENDEEIIQVSGTAKKLDDNRGESVPVVDTSERPSHGKDDKLSHSRHTSRNSLTFLGVNGNDHDAEQALEEFTRAGQATKASHLPYSLSMQAGQNRKVLSVSVPRRSLSFSDYKVIAAESHGESEVSNGPGDQIVHPLVNKIHEARQESILKGLDENSFNGYEDVLDFLQEERGKSIQDANEEYLKLEAPTRADQKEETAVNNLERGVLVERSIAENKLEDQIAEQFTSASLVSVSVERNQIEDSEGSHFSEENQEEPSNGHDSNDKANSPTPDRISPGSCENGGAGSASLIQGELFVHREPLFVDVREASDSGIEQLTLTQAKEEAYRSDAEGFANVTTNDKGVGVEETGEVSQQVRSDGREGKLNDDVQGDDIGDSASKFPCSTFSNEENVPSRSASLKDEEPCYLLHTGPEGGHPKNNSGSPSEEELQAQEVELTQSRHRHVEVAADTMFPSSPAKTDHDENDDDTSPTSSVSSSPSYHEKSSSSSSSASGDDESSSSSSSYKGRILSGISENDAEHGSFSTFGPRKGEELAMQLSMIVDLGEAAGSPDAQAEGKIHGATDLSKISSSSDTESKAHESKRICSDKVLDDSEQSLALANGSELHPSNIDKLEFSNGDDKDGSSGSTLHDIPEAVLLLNLECVEASRVPIGADAGLSIFYALDLKSAEGPLPEQSEGVRSSDFTNAVTSSTKRKNEQENAGDLFAGGGVNEQKNPRLIGPPNYRFAEDESPVPSQVKVVEISDAENIVDRLRSELINGGGQGIQLAYSGREIPLSDDGLGYDLAHEHAAGERSTSSKQSEVEIAKFDYSLHAAAGEEQTLAPDPGRGATEGSERDDSLYVDSEVYGGTTIGSPEGPLGIDGDGEDSALQNLSRHQHVTRICRYKSSDQTEEFEDGIISRGVTDSVESDTGKGGSGVSPASNKVNDAPAEQEGDKIELTHDDELSLAEGMKPLPGQVTGEETRATEHFQWTSTEGNDILTEHNMKQNVPRGCRCGDYERMIGKGKNGFSAESTNSSDLLADEEDVSPAANAYRKSNMLHKAGDGNSFTIQVEEEVGPTLYVGGSQLLGSEGSLPTRAATADSNFRDLSFDAEGEEVSPSGHGYKEGKVDKENQPLMHEIESLPGQAEEGEANRGKQVLNDGYINDSKDVLLRITEEAGSAGICNAEVSLSIDEDKRDSLSEHFNKDGKEMWSTPTKYAGAAVTNHATDELHSNGGNLLSVESKGQGLIGIQILGEDFSPKGSKRPPSGEQLDKECAHIEEDKSESTELQIVALRDQKEANGRVTNVGETTLLGGDDLLLEKANGGDAAGSIDSKSAYTSRARTAPSSVEVDDIQEPDSDEKKLVEAESRFGAEKIANFSSSKSTDGFILSLPSQEQKDSGIEVEYAKMPKMAKIEKLLPVDFNVRGVLGNMGIKCCLVNDHSLPKYSSTESGDSEIPGHAKHTCLPTDAIVSPSKQEQQDVNLMDHPMTSKFSEAEDTLLVKADAVSAPGEELLDVESKEQDVVGMQSLDESSSPHENARASLSKLFERQCLVNDDEGCKVAEVQILSPSLGNQDEADMPATDIGETTLVKADDLLLDEANGGSEDLVAGFPASRKTLNTGASGAAPSYVKADDIEEPNTVEQTAKSVDGEIRLAHKIDGGRHPSSSSSERNAEDFLSLPSQEEKDSGPVVEDATMSRMTDDAEVPALAKHKSLPTDDIVSPRQEDQHEPKSMDNPKSSKFREAPLRVQADADNSAVNNAHAVLLNSGEGVLASSPSAIPGSRGGDPLITLTKSDQIVQTEYERDDNLLGSFTGPLYNMKVNFATVNFSRAGTTPVSIARYLESSRETVQKLNKDIVGEEVATKKDIGGMDCQSGDEKKEDRDSRGHPGLGALARSVPATPGTATEEFQPGLDSTSLRSFIFTPTFFESSVGNDQQTTQENVRQRRRWKSFRALCYACCMRPSTM